MTQRQNSPFRRLNLQIRHPLFANYDLFPNFVTVNIDVYSVSICLSFSLKCHGSTNEQFVHWAAAIRESGRFFCSGKSFASDAEGNRRRAVVEASREAHFVAERRHPHVTRYAERSGSVPGLSHLPLNCVPEARHFPINNALCHAKNRRRTVSYVSTGLARLPRDTNTRTSTAEERL